jgi:hypothetical protein
VIGATVHLIVDELDRALRRQNGAIEPLVVATSLTEPGGGPVHEAADKVAVFLVNIEREIIPARAPRQVDAGQARVGVRPPPVYLNLLLMFAANFAGSKYDEGLKRIAEVIAFFQGRPVFNRLNTPNLDPGLDQLSLEIENLSTSDLSNLWGVIGGRYAPSVLYRVRVIAIDSGQLSLETPRVESTTVGLEPATAA